MHICDSYIVGEPILQNETTVSFCHSKKTNNDFLFKLCVRRKKSRWFMPCQQTRCGGGDRERAKGPRESQRTEREPKDRERAEGPRESQRAETRGWASVAVCGAQGQTPGQLVVAACSAQGQTQGWAVVVARGARADARVGGGGGVGRTGQVAWPTLLSSGAHNQPMSARPARARETCLCARDLPVRATPARAQPACSP